MHNTFYFFILAASILFPVHANQVLSHSHARRSQAIKTSIERRQLFGNDGSGGLLGGLLDGNDDDNDGLPNILAPQPSSSSLFASSSALNSLSSTVLPLSSSTLPTPTPTPSPTPSDNGGLLGGVGGALGGVVSGLGGTVNGATSGLGGAVGGAASGLGGAVNGVLGGGDPSPTTSLLPPVSFSGSGSPSTITPPPNSSSGGGGGGGLLGGVTSILGPVGSAVGGVVSPVNSVVESGVLSPVGSIISPVTSVVGSGVLSPVASVISPVASAVGSGVLSPVASVVSPVASVVGSGVLSPVASVVSPVASGVLSPVGSIISPVTSALSSVTSIVGSVGSGILSPIPTVVSSLTGALPTIVSSPGGDVTSILPPVTQPDPSTSIPPTVIPISLPTSSAAPTISFPTPVANTSTTYTPTQSASEITITSTATTTVSVDPGLSFVLTESSLAFTSIPTTTVDPTMTDPDAATTTAENVAAQAANIPTSVPLPNGLPARIFPREPLDFSEEDLSGFTLISILFNNQLNWPFVVNNTLASSQIFAYVPVLISTALQIPNDQIKTYALQVFIPTSYRGPSDVAELGSTWLGYIGSDLVDTLAAQIKVKSSAFYTQAPNGVASDLADRVVSGYSLLSVPDPNTSPGSGGPDPNNVGSSGDSGKSRQDAIIGVVSALGAIALLVLVFLVYRSMKRRRQLAHRRLSDPPDEVLGVRPPGRDFDQDSVGGARRRSFYYAEDSLRVFENQASANDQLMQDVSSGNVTQRRHVVNTGAISAPVLRGSTMNW